jgi:site-specific DNA recombinase
MVAYLRENGSVKHILVEKTDRLYRNFKDLLTIDELGRNVHFVKEGQVIGPDARSSDKLSHNIKVVLAKNYIDNLSEETRKGMLEKAEQGLFPSFAPLGYVNDRESSGIVVDFERAHRIRKIFEVYAEGRMSLRDLTALAYREGLRSRKGGRVQKSAIAKMLENRVYVGDFVWKGVCYKGKHEPIVRLDVFEKVQSILHGKRRPRGKGRQYAFRGLVRCGNCGCSLSPELIKGQYLYYRCTRARGNCDEKGIREENLARLLGEPLKRIRMTEERVEWVRDALRKSSEQEKGFREAEVEKLKDEHAELERKIDRMYEDRLSGTVSPEFWRRKYAEYWDRKEMVGVRIKAYEGAHDNYLSEGLRILELAQEAYSLYVRQDSFEQRKLLDMILSNCQLKDGKIVADFCKFFQILADGVAEEEQLAAENIPFEARNKNWLPG